MDTIVDAGGRRRRSWSVAEKRRMVEESLEPGASVSVVARRYDVNANLLFSWRRLYQSGLLTAETALVPVEISQPPVETAAATAEHRSSTAGRSRPGMIEIALTSGTRLRLRGSIDANVLRQVIDVLSGR
jgi:transposase